MEIKGDDNKKDEPEKATPTKKGSPKKVTKRRNAVDTRDYDDDLKFSFIRPQQTVSQARQRFEAYKRRVEKRYEKNREPVAGPSGLQKLRTDKAEKGATKNNEQKKQEQDQASGDSQEEKEDGGEKKQEKKEQQVGAAEEKNGKCQKRKEEQPEKKEYKAKGALYKKKGLPGKVGKATGRKG